MYSGFSDTHASETRLHTATAAGLEEKERLEHLIVKDFKNDAKGHKERLIQGHRVRERLEELQSQAAKLVSSNWRASRIGTRSGLAS